MSSLVEVVPFRSPGLGLITQSWHSNQAASFLLCVSSKGRVRSITRDGSPLYPQSFPWQGGFAVECAIWFGVLSSRQSSLGSIVWGEHSTTLPQCGRWLTHGSRSHCRCNRHYKPWHDASNFSLCPFGLTHLGRDKMAAIFQMTFSNAFSWMKTYEFQLRFHWSLFPGVQLPIVQHWFR